MAKLDSILIAAGRQDDVAHVVVSDDAIFKQVFPDRKPAEPTWKLGPSYIELSMTFMHFAQIIYGHNTCKPHQILQVTSLLKGGGSAAANLSRSAAEKGLLQLSCLQHAGRLTGTQQPQRGRRESAALSARLEAIRNFELPECHVHLHSKGYHSDSSDGVWECGTCHKEFYSERALMQHCDATGHSEADSDEGSDDTVWECDTCLKEFSTERALRQHADATDHYCTYC